MKVLFINKYENSGGAAIAAQRIREGLERYYPVQHHYLAGVHHTAAANVTATRSNAVTNFIERGLNVLFNRLGLQYFYFPFSSPAILQCTKAYQPDVISLHNIHGGYFDTSLLPKLSSLAPIVWTLHDMWAITGNAAHTFGDNSWKVARAGKYEYKHAPALGLPTGNFLIKRKQRLYAASNLHLVAPSRWLYNMIAESPLTQDKPRYHIPNPIDTDHYKPQDRAASRRALGLPANAQVITFVSERLFTSEFKGGDGLLKMLHLLDTQLDKNVYLLMIGKDRLPGTFKHLQCVYTGYVKETNKMMQCYSASDIFIYPTKADNLPNVLIEAGSCETVCITFDAGGCKEIVLDNQTGYVIAPGMHEYFATKVLTLLNDPDICRQFGKAARIHIEQHFSMKVIAEKYYQLFASVTGIQQ